MVFFFKTNINNDVDQNDSEMLLCISDNHWQVTTICLTWKDIYLATIEKSRVKREKRYNYYI